MRAWQIKGEYGIDQLKRVELPAPEADKGQVVVEMRAASLNYRDLVTVRGVPGATPPAALIPCSDGAGEVQAIGQDVNGIPVAGPILRRYSKRSSAGSCNLSLTAHSISTRYPMPCEPWSRAASSASFASVTE